MKRRLSILFVILAAVAYAIAAMLKPVEYSACAAFECATQLDARESEPRRVISERWRVCDAVERFSAAMASNALATCQMEVREIPGRELPIVNVRVSAKSDAMACSIADFLVDDFCAWLESQNQIAFDKNTAEIRVAISEARQSGREPDRGLVERLASAQEVFDRDGLKVRVVERAHVVSVKRVWQKVRSLSKEGK